MVQRVVRSRPLPLTHIPPPRLCPINAKDPGRPKMRYLFNTTLQIHNFKPFREQPWSSEVIGGQQRFSQVSTQLPNCSFIHSCTIFVLFKILKNKDLTKRIKLLICRISSRQLWHMRRLSMSHFSWKFPFYIWPIAIFSQ